MRHILVIDDIKSISQATSDFPSVLDGCMVSRVTTYEVALDTIKQSAGRFDVWVLDHDLDCGYTGIQLMQEVVDRFPHKWPLQINFCSSSFTNRKKMHEVQESLEKKLASIFQVPSEG